MTQPGHSEHTHSHPAHKHMSITFPKIGLATTVHMTLRARDCVMRRGRGLGVHLEQAVTHTPQLWWEFTRGVNDGQEEAVGHGQQVTLVFLQNFIVVQSKKKKLHYVSI